MKEPRAAASDRTPRAVWWFVVLAVLVQVVAVVVIAQPKPNTLAGGLLQAIASGLGIYASWAFGRGSIEKAAQESIAPRARPAIRRAIALYRDLDEHARLLERDATRLRDASRPDSGNQVVVDFLLVDGIVTNGKALMRVYAHQAEAAIWDWTDVAKEAAKEVADENADYRRAEEFKDED